ncbi:MAG: YbaK/EbsC family protein [Candidatus Eiseniibacteriota bacterium]
MATTPERKVLDTLATLGIDHEVIEIDPAYADTAVFCEKYGIPAERSANTILVASKKEPRKFAACVVLATTQLDVNRRVRGLLEVPRVSFATAEEMRALTGMEVGGVTPFSLPSGMPLYVDARVMEPDWIVLGGGGRSIKLKLPPDALVRAGAVVVEGLAHPRTESAREA